jgi:hypothetical protein
VPGIHTPSIALLSARSIQLNLRRVHMFNCQLQYLLICINDANPSISYLAYLLTYLAYLVTSSLVTALG